MLACLERDLPQRAAPEQMRLHAARNERSTEMGISTGVNA